MEKAPIYTKARKRGLQKQLQQQKRQYWRNVQRVVHIELSSLFNLHRQPQFISTLSALPARCSRNVSICCCSWICFSSSSTLSLFTYPNKIKYQHTSNFSLRVLHQPLLPILLLLFLYRSVSTWPVHSTVPTVVILLLLVHIFGYYVHHQLPSRIYRSTINSIAIIQNEVF